jgi:[acyl-carrier-protein] S-malonyltransferase
MEAFAAALEVRAPRIPYICHRGPSYLRTEDEVREALVRQIAEPVLWSDSLRALAADGATVFVDMGPGSVLQRSIRWVLRGARALSVEDGSGPDDVLAAAREGAGAPQAAAP